MNFKNLKDIRLYFKPVGKQIGNRNKSEQNSNDSFKPSITMIIFHMMKRNYKNVARQQITLSNKSYNNAK